MVEITRNPDGTISFPLKTWASAEAPTAADHYTLPLIYDKGLKQELSKSGGILVQSTAEKATSSTQIVWGGQMNSSSAPLVPSD